MATSASSARTMSPGSEPYEVSSLQNADLAPPNPPPNSYETSGAFADGHLLTNVERTTSPRTLESHSRSNSDGSERSNIFRSANYTTPRGPNVSLEGPKTDSRPQAPPNGIKYHQQDQPAAANPYQPPPAIPPENSSSPPPPQPYYGSGDNQSPERTGPRMAPSVVSGLNHSWSGTNIYSPQINNDHTVPTDTRNRSTSYSSTYSSTSTNVEDLYAPPSRHPRREPSEMSDYGDYVSRYNYPGDVAPHKTTSLAVDHSSGQELSLSAATQAPYAPSPSLLGSNDPLGRTAARVPVFSFGFGGKLVTCFHGSSVLNTGFDVALSSRRSKDVNIRILSKIIPESALHTSSAVFPGPLFADPGTPTVSLVRTGTTKTKKARVIKYLTEREEEVFRGIEHLHPGTEDRRKLEGKLALVKLLKVMVENDGSLSGT